MEINTAVTIIKTTYLGYKQDYNRRQISKLIDVVKNKEECPILKDDTPLTARSASVTACNHAFNSGELRRWIDVSPMGGGSYLQIFCCWRASCPSASTSGITHARSNSTHCSLREQNVDLHFGGEIKAAITHGVGDKTRAEVLTLLIQPEVQTYDRYLYTIASEISQEDQAYAALTPDQTAVITALREQGVDLHFDGG